MKLDDTQRQTVAEWIEQGLKLAEIQKRLETDLGLRMTYLEARLLVDDMKLTPKDQIREESKPAEAAPETEAAPPAPEPPPQAAPGKVSVSVDAVTRPGALISGAVTFTDGKSAAWYLDQMGRLGVAPKEQGYKPPEADLQAFQTELQQQLQGLGF